MNDKLIEELLNEDESSSLDFKRDQYPFDKATDDQKSEIIKDIIAFANAWKRTDAYILIGIEEVKGGRSKIVGVQNHLNESNLQQLVNSKTKFPVNFSYQAYQFDGVQIGIITIPVQQRPIYLIKNFGKLIKEVVYIRRGSSTVEAKPDEIAKMGIAAAQGEKKVPILDLYFGDISIRKQLGLKVTLKSLILFPRLSVDLIKPKPKTNSLGIDLDSIDPFSNKQYYEELIMYVFRKNALNPIGFVIENVSREVASGVQLKAVIKHQEGARVFDQTNAPRLPSHKIIDNISMENLSMKFLNKPIPSINEYNGNLELNINFGDVLPGYKTWTTEPIYIGSKIPQNIDFIALIYAKNLPVPIKIPLSLQLESETRPMEFPDVNKCLYPDI